MERKFDRKIVLECGEEYYGYGFGADAEKVCEVVVNTSVVGYQEVISDLSNTDQMVVMTYPLIGNYGITDEEFESKNPSLGALVVREYNDLPSNFRSTQTLSETMHDYGIPGIEGVDTRKLTRYLRDNGVCRAIICDAALPVEEAVARIKKAPVSDDLAARVSTRKKWYSRTAKHRFNVVVIDLGVRLSLIRALNGAGCNVTVVPYNIGAAEIREMRPHGIIISDGPGSPENVRCVSNLIRELKGRYPVFGVSLGCQVVAQAYGGTAYKMKFGHRGSNHPVKNLETGKIIIAAQNHGYAIREASLEDTGLVVTHRNVLDGTVEGIACYEDCAFGVQYSPELSPVSAEDTCLFESFIKSMSR